jgi:hypothetical protein
MVPGLAARALKKLHLACTSESSTFVEADKYEAWRAVMQEEMKFVKNVTWELVDLLHIHRPIGLKWVFKLKRTRSVTSSSTRLASSQGLRPVVRDQPQRSFHPCCAARIHVHVACAGW